MPSFKALRIQKSVSSKHRKGAREDPKEHARICAKTILKISTTQRKPITLQWIIQASQRSGVRPSDVIDYFKKRNIPIQ